MAFDNPIFNKMYEDVYLHRQASNNVKIHARVIADGEEFYIPDVVSLNVIRDYIGSYHDVTMLKLKVPVTTYISKLYPNKLALDVQIKYEIASNKGDNVSSPEFWIRNYKAIMVDPVDPETIVVDKEEPEGSDKAMTAMSVLKLQLIDKFAYSMSYVQTGGLWPSCKVEDLLKVKLSHKLQKKEDRKSLLNKDFTELRGVDMIPPDNGNPRLLYAKKGMYLPDLPYYLQEEFGVYENGLGHYYQMNYTVDDYYQSANGGFWFVYPIANFNRFQSAPRKLTVFITPEKEVVDPERTFTYYDKQLFVFATGKSAAADFTEYNFYNNGNGISYSKSSELLDTVTRTENNKVLTDIAQTKRTLMTLNRKDGINDIRVVGGVFTDNPFKHIAKLAQANCKVVTVQWSNSMPDLLIPGMPTKIMYLYKGEIVEKNAVLVKVDAVHKKVPINMLNDTHTIHSILTFIVESQE